jgi:alkylhydroperoxidase family enzyme
MLAHAPEVDAFSLRLVFTLLTETTLDPKLRELVILRVAKRLEGQYVWVQHAAIAATVGVSDFQIAALQRMEASAWLFSDRERTAFADEVLDTCRATA